MMPQVSVIIPVYNVEAYLRRCIDSVLAQTFTDFELILVDDGSSDRSGVICDEYAANDSRIHVIHQENSGVARARNAALTQISGKFVAFCDSDDWWEPNLLQLAYSAAVENAADMVVFNYAKNENGRIISQSQFLSGVFPIRTEAERIDYLISKLARYKHGNEIWNKLFRRSIIQKHGIQFCTKCNDYGEDYGFMVKCALRSTKVVCIDDCCYHYRVRTGSITHQEIKRYRFDELNEVCYDFKETFDDVFANKHNRKAFSIFHFLSLHYQYSCFIGKEIYSSMPSELAKIKNRKWYRKNVLSLFSQYRTLVHYFGTTTARQILLFSLYCLHGNWKRFSIESKIAYKFFI